jgi:hypothetical protein
LAGQIKVDSINADSNLALKIANTAVAFIDSSGLRPISGNVNLDATATSKLYLPSANTVAIQTAGVTGLSISSSQVVTLANALAVTSGGTGVTTSTGTGAVVLGTSPTITGATITVAATAAPAFSAYMSTNQTVTTNTYTKAALNTEEFDTNSNFDSVTNYRFTPTVAGYYQINAGVSFSTTVTYAQILIYKNGASYKYNFSQLSAGNYTQNISSIVYCNGSTDYIELYGYMLASTPTFGGGIAATWFNGAMVRSA